MIIKKTKIELLAFLIVFVISGIAFSGPVAAANYDVDSSMSNAQIQSVFDNAAVGDSINFLTGIYNNVALTITNTLNLVGNGAILNSDGSSSVLTVIGSGASGTNITGLTIKGNGNCYGINATNTSGLNIASNNFTYNKIAVYFSNVTGSSIESNGIYNNTNYGVSISDNGNLTSLNNIVIDGNNLINSTCGFSIGGSGFNITNNVLDMFNSTATGIGAGTLYNTQIVNNTLSNGGDGINLAGYILNLTVTGNKIDNMTRRYGDGISIMNHDNTSVSSVIANNTLNNNMFGLYLGGYFNGLISGNLLNNSATCAINKTQKMGPGILNATITGNNIVNAGIGISLDNQVTFMNLSNNNISSSQANIQYTQNYVKNGTILIENNNLSNTQTWVLKPSMTTDYIQSLIDGAKSGDTIIFAPGTYNGTNLIINKTLHFVANGAVLNNFTLDSSTPQVPPKPLYGNLTIKSSTDPATLKTGGKTTYTITVRNTGTSNATNVKVADILKSSFFSSSTLYASIGSYANGIWNIGSLSSGNTASLVVTATAIKSGVTSSQAIATANGNIKATSNTIKKTIQKNVVVGSSNTISASKAKVGSFVYLTTTVTNTGKDISDPLTLKMSLPKGAKLVSVTQKAYYNSKNNSWTFKLKSGAKQQFTTKVKVTSKGTKTVKFVLNGKTQSKSFKGY